jgi:hypothetical protein
MFWVRRVCLRGLLVVEEGKERGHEVHFETHDGNIREIVKSAWRDDALLGVIPGEEKPRHVHNTVFRELLKDC